MSLHKTLLAAAVAAVFALSVYAQMSGSQQAQPQTKQGGGMMGGGMMGGQRQGGMMRGGPNSAMMEKMHAEMREANARLETSLKAMNAATGQAKIDAMATVVNELADQHRRMFQAMETMHGGGGAQSGTAARTPGATSKK